MSYRLTPELKAALRRLPLRQRIVTRWKLHRRLMALSRVDEAYCGLLNRYDCGADLIDHFTGGRMTRLRSEYEERKAAVMEITVPLIGEA